MNNMTGMVARSNTKDEERERVTPLFKQFRKEVDGLIQRVTRDNTKETPTGSILGGYTYFESETVRTKLIEAKMWAGKMLEALDNPFPPELADKAE